MARKLLTNPIKTRKHADIKILIRCPFLSMNNPITGHMNMQQRKAVPINCPATS